MATFPTLIPSSRTFTPGSYPHSSFAGMSGRSNRVRNSNVMLSSQLRLTFAAITESQMLSILTHYQGQQGTFQSFPLPTAIWSGVSSINDYQLSGYGWRYIEPPNVSDAMCANAYDVELTLETVPPEGTAIAGLDFLVLARLVAGTATAQFSFNVAVSLAAGTATGDIPGFDTDASSYILSVEAADGQQLESGVRNAINSFVIGCKADGIWNAIKASCILSGARTLAGALVPLVGTAPTNFNFAAGDYNRKTGLVGDGSTKYLDSGRANSIDPQNSQHLSVYASSVGTSTLGVYIGDATSGQSGASYLYRNNNDSGTLLGVSRCGPEFNGGASSASQSGLYGINRSSAASYLYRRNGANTSVTQASVTPTTGNIHVFRLNRSSSNLNTNARIAFYSIGESLTLALLDARVTTLISSFASAIP